MFRFSEADPDTEAYLALVRARAGDLGVPSERIHAAVSIQAHIRDIRAGLLKCGVFVALNASARN